jgi:tetratricopeptide (TPR) repeat protein
MRPMVAAPRGNPLFAVLLLALLAGACQRPAPAPVEPAQLELVSGGQPLLRPGARWRYLDDGSDPGARWMARNYDDRSWKSGPAPLGFGLGSEATVVGFGPDPANKHPATYFRGEFRLATVASVERLVVRVQHDDGAAIYLNGVEIYRQNLPAGPLARTIFSLAPQPPAIVERVLEPAVFQPLLRNGRNVVAAEVHQSDPASPELRFDLAVIANPAVTVTRGPYLQIGTPTEATIRWRTDLPARGRVTYGPMGAGGPMQVADGDGGLTTEHEVRVTGLTPATRYDYTIGTPAGLLRGGDGDHFFVTPPLPGSAKPTRIWVIGDSGTADANAAAVYRAYRDFNGLRHTDVWLMLGDNAYLIGTDEEFQRAVFDFYPEMLRQVFLWPVIGNHETYVGGPVDRTPYLESFSMPTRGEAGGLASGTELYYSFDHGNIHFVALDSMVSSRAPGAPMWTWLESDLAATDKTWLIAFWHHPPYSKGSHDSDNSNGLDPELVEMREQALPILEAHGVDLVLSGHSHSYERSYFLRGHYGDSSTLAPKMKVDNGNGRGDGTGAYVKAASARGANDGAVYLVAGSAGLTTPMRGAHPAMLVSLVELGSLVIDVDGHDLRARFLRDTGEVEDEFSIAKNVPPATQPPQPPSDLRAFAGPRGGTALFWSHEGQDETGFRIERAVRDGPFVTLDDLGANASDFADDSAAHDRFRYRVRATNASGSSEPSNIATVELMSGPGGMVTGGPPGDHGGTGRVLRTAGGGGLRCDLGGREAGCAGWWWVLILAATILRRRRLAAHESRQRALQMGPGPVLAAVVTALLALPAPAWAHGTLAERLVALDAEIATHPERGETYLRRGELLRQLGRPESALADFVRAAEVQPGIAGLDREAARTLIDLERPEEAKTRLDRAIAATPEDATAWGMRAAIFERSGQPARAARDLRRMVELRGPSATPDDHLRLVKALRESKQLAAAARAVDAAIAQLGSVVTLELAAIEIARQQGRWKEAVTRVDAFAARVPRPEPWLIRKATILASAGRPKEARAAYEQALAAIERLPPETRSTPAVAQLAAQARAQLQRGR